MFEIVAVAVIDGESSERAALPRGLSFYPRDRLIKAHDIPTAFAYPANCGGEKIRRDGQEPVGVEALAARGLDVVHHENDAHPAGEGR